MTPAQPSGALRGNPVGVGVTGYPSISESAQGTGRGAEGRRWRQGRGWGAPGAGRKEEEGLAGRAQGQATEEPE